MRRTLLISYAIDLTAIAIGIAGVLQNLPGLLVLAGLVLAAGIFYAVAQFRCPFCHKFVGIGNYAPSRCCPFCGAELEDR